MARAVNAISEVRLTADGSLFVDGKTEDEFKAVRIEIAVIDPKDSSRRLQNAITGSPVTPGWAVQLPQDDLGLKPFADAEPVHVVGVATSDAGEVYVWGGVATADGGAAMEVAVVARGVA